MTIPRGLEKRDIFCIDMIASLIQTFFVMDSSKRRPPHVRLIKSFDQAITMYNAGLSIDDCAHVYGISRQSMWLSLKRRGVKFRDHLRKGKNSNLYTGGKASPEHNTRIGSMVQKAIRRGVLTPEPCEVCSEVPARAHHDDYNKPLDIRWLCYKHHFEWHKSYRPIPLGTPLKRWSHYRSEKGFAPIRTSKDGKWLGITKRNEVG